MTQQPLISVIVPVYNVEQYVERCLNSLLHQKYQNIEIIVVDDGSTDSSSYKCEKIAREDTRVTVLHKSNGGLSSARNYGLKHATGKWIVFVDSDDYVHEEYISCMHDIALQTNADMVICDYIKGKKDSFPRTSQTNNYKVYTSEEMLRNWHAELTPIETPSWNKLLLREQLECMNFQYPEGVVYEDVRTTHLLVAHASRIAVTERKLYYYFQRKGSTVRGIKKEKNINDNLESQDIRISFFEGNGYTEAVWRLKKARQKWYMLIYILTDSLEIKIKLRYAFRNSYYELINNKKTEMWEKMIFGFFKQYLKIGKNGGSYAS